MSLRKTLEGAVWQRTVAFLWQSGGEAVGHPAARVQCISWQAGGCWVCYWSWFDQTWFCLRDPGRLSRQARMSFHHLEQSKLEKFPRHPFEKWFSHREYQFSFPNIFSSTPCVAFLKLQRLNDLERKYWHLTASSCSGNLFPPEWITWL